MTLNILEALQAAQPEEGPKRCKLARFLASIPADHPQLSSLTGAVADSDSWPAPRLSIAFHNLGFTISASQVRDHRGRRCICRGCF